MVGIHTTDDDYYASKVYIVESIQVVLVKIKEIKSKVTNPDKNDVEISDLSKDHVEVVIIHMDNRSIIEEIKLNCNRKG